MKTWRKHRKIIEIQYTCGSIFKWWAFSLQHGINYDRYDSYFGLALLWVCTITIWVIYSTICCAYAWQFMLAVCVYMCQSFCPLLCLCLFFSVACFKHMSSLVRFPNICAYLSVPSMRGLYMLDVTVCVCVCVNANNVFFLIYSRPLLVCLFAHVFVCPTSAKFDSISIHIQAARM